MQCSVVCRLMLFASSAAIFGVLAAGVDAPVAGCSGSYAIVVGEYAAVPAKQTASDDESPSQGTSEVSRTISSDDEAVTGGHDDHSGEAFFLRSGSFAEMMAFLRGVPEYQIADNEFSQIVEGYFQELDGMVHDDGLLSRGKILDSFRDPISKEFVRDKIVSALLKFMSLEKINEKYQWPDHAESGRWWYRLKSIFGWQKTNAQQAAEQKTDEQQAAEQKKEAEWKAAEQQVMQRIVKEQIAYYERYLWRKMRALLLFYVTWEKKAATEAKIQAAEAKVQAVEAKFQAEVARAVAEGIARYKMNEEADRQRISIGLRGSGERGESMPVNTAADVRSYSPPFGDDEDRVSEAGSFTSNGTTGTAVKNVRMTLFDRCPHVPQREVADRMLQFLRELDTRNKTCLREVRRKENANRRQAKYALDVDDE